mmetsp:Transcript_4846/g.10565  ORF Transcript_4846/g.10565 Transcript_4846/m.10565 type:complete len:235 (+) Transcript_4846:96-800(+)
MISVIRLVTGSGYIADERRLLGICKTSYGDTELLRIVLRREKERRFFEGTLFNGKYYWKLRKPKSRTLLSYACEREDAIRIQLLLSLRASNCIFCLPRAVELGRFDIAKLILDSDPTAIEYLLNPSLKESRQNVLQFAGLPGVSASHKVDLGLAYNLPQLITDNLMEGTEDRDWMGWEEGRDWPMIYRGPGLYTYEDPLHLRAAGYVWIDVTMEFDEYFDEELFNWGHDRGIEA